MFKLSNAWRVTYTIRGYTFHSQVYMYESNAIALCEHIRKRGHVAHIHPAEI